MAPKGQSLFDGLKCRRGIVSKDKTFNFAPRYVRVNVDPLTISVYYFPYVSTQNHIPSLQMSAHHIKHQHWTFPQTILRRKLVT